MIQECYDGGQVAEPFAGGALWRLANAERRSKVRAKGQQREGEKHFLLASS